jgi:hypothetical protein
LPARRLQAAPRTAPAVVEGMQTKQIWVRTHSRNLTQTGDDSPAALHEP